MATLLKKVDMKKSLGVIGYGKLGSNLSNLFAKEFSVAWIIDSNQKTRKIASKKLPNVKILSSFKKVPDLPDYIFLTVEDSSIGNLAIEISEYFKEKLKKKLVLHCSGALSLGILNPLKKYGADIAVIHPYQTFYYPSENLLSGIGWSIRSENRSEELKKLITKLGGIPFVMNDDDKQTALYHCSAVVASNFLNTLLSTAKEIAKLAGIPAEMFIPQIINTTIENNFSQIKNKKDFPLTGPYSRADLKTIKKHIKALQKHPFLLKSYCYMALSTIEKIKSEKMSDQNKITEIESLIKNYV
ncbi:DUF2520 domain-containing protein [Bacteroidetes/Chlorobi group bacterium ChocPot_Mid]|nr:MAG: DUF2520 domain-containing protein [Bacteroidetes/Chlorobi group bacterium ChocPot_Mid]